MLTNLAREWFSVWPLADWMTLPWPAFMISFLVIIIGNLCTFSYNMTNILETGGDHNEFHCRKFNQAKVKIILKAAQEVKEKAEGDNMGGSQSTSKQKVSTQDIDQLVSEESNYSFFYLRNMHDLSLVLDMVVCCILTLLLTMAWRWLQMMKEELHIY